MRLRSALVFVLLGCSAFLIPGQVLSENASSKPRRITLLIRELARNIDNYDKASVSFRINLYDAVKSASNDRDLLYGGISFNGDRDWFIVRLGRDDRSRIKDLGEMDWSDDMAVPVLPILPCPTSNNWSWGTSNDFCHYGNQIPKSSSGKKIQDVNLHIAKPMVGHMYLVHIHDGLSEPSGRQEFYFPLDFYTLFRVEELKPNESCTITWKRIPSPKK